MDVAIRLKNIIDDRGVKYIAISKATGIPVDAISRSFLGKRKMLADEFVAICDFLHISSDDLLRKPEGV